MATDVRVKDLTSAEALVGTWIPLLEQLGEDITRPALAQVTGRCNETVRRALYRFVHEGWLVKERREDPCTGAILPSLYRLSSEAPSLFHGTQLSLAA